MNIKNLERREALRYSPGKPVELKQKPGEIQIIAEYDPMMVPPVWLANDPMPHYLHELRLMSNLYCVLSSEESSAA